MWTFSSSFSLSSFWLAFFFSPTGLYTLQIKESKGKGKQPEKKRMTESAYLKSSVGPVLAKAVAETVLAQPSNPQEYLALYLLHVLQEEERRGAAAERKKKAEVQRQMWASERALREKRAADTIQRFYRQCKRNLQLRREEEEALWSKYEEAEGEAEELLDEEETAAAAGKSVDDADKMDGKDGAAAAGGVDGNNEEEMIEDAASAMEEARREFYKAQRFMLHIRKALIGALKKELTDQREQIRVEQDRMYDVLDLAEVERREREEAEFVAAVTAGAIPSSAAITELVKKSTIPRHERISTSMILYRVLRCWCYFFFDSTPKQTDTPAKVAALVKPFTFMQLLRAFNPVASYQRNRPLRIGLEGKHEEGEGDADDTLQDGGEEPLPQPKPRQARRVSRVLRVLMHDGEYVCAVNPADYLDEEEGVEKNSTASERGAALATLVETAAKKHGVMLYALLRMLRTASAYRDARDHWISLLQQNGQDVPPNEEMPEDDDADSKNEEGLRDDDGEVDEAAVRRLLLVIGTDTDEALAKLWADQDEMQRKKWQAMAAARRSEEEEEVATNDEGEEDTGDE
ncbi:hypothetical protein MOQ_008965 [Trypanosoma cruzi marinkellei]|uniref:Uncharacterized protein n=1 Tax=Trypanosoma cruzi marinkellei TaxID=85056 RepID=K2LXC9_TRYCR|nr:hypothetical protein MOQ_008965 [Trypanosoma cruzi marinkellei]